MLTTSIFTLGAEEGRKLLDTTMGVEGAIVTETQTLVSRRFHAYATA